MNSYQQMSRTKIICTIGPASDDPEVLRSLMLAGMNVARLNFSHGTHAEHKVRLEKIKKLREELGLPLAIMLDTRGPEIRTGAFAGGSAVLEAGKEVRIVHEDMIGSAEAFSMTYKKLHEDVREGTKILIADGLIELEVLAVEAQDVICRVLAGGEIADQKNVNLPDVKIQLPAITEKDIDDLRFAVANQIDWIAASFIREASDILQMRKILAAEGDKNIKICAKIENRQGIENFDAILAVADGIMVARGDLGVGIPSEEVPLTQKKLIQETFSSGIPSITATQMLDSMMENPRPTRAEVSDVANAILDGTSCIMLSGESAAGKYPLEAVKMMQKIACFTESHTPYWDRFSQRKSAENSLTQAMCHAACTTARDIGAKAIIAVTHSGRTARMLAHFRPGCPIIGVTASERVRNQLALSWGVNPCLAPYTTNTDELFPNAIQSALDAGLVKQHDVVVMVGGTPAGVSGTTNTMKVETIGTRIALGKPVVSDQDHRKIVGDALVVQPEQLPQGQRLMRNYILVCQQTWDALLPLMRDARAVVVEDASPYGHAVSICQGLNLPLIYGAEGITRAVSSGQNLHLDFETGEIS